MNNCLLSSWEITLAFWPVNLILMANVAVYSTQVFDSKDFIRNTSEALKTRLDFTSTLFVNLIILYTMDSSRLTVGRNRLGLSTPR